MAGYVWTLNPSGRQSKKMLVRILLYIAVLQIIYFIKLSAFGTKSVRFWSYLTKITVPFLKMVFPE